jgi:hypothetical protein
MSSAERELFTAMAERLRQLRRRRGIPNGVSLEEAIALHFVSTDEVERARWGDESPIPLCTPASPPPPSSRI